MTTDPIYRKKWRILIATRIAFNIAPILVTGPFFHLVYFFVEAIRARLAKRAFRADWSENLPFIRQKKSELKQIAPAIEADKNNVAEVNKEAVEEPIVEAPKAEESNTDTDSSTAPQPDSEEDEQTASPATDNSASEQSQETKPSFDELMQTRAREQWQGLINRFPESENSLFYVFHMDYPENTNLHGAIVANATESALKLIQENPQDLNAIAGGNTPLLLALKKGNQVVAKAILSHDDIDVNVVDGYGYSAIDYAAMLRMNDVIELLLAKGATIDTKREEVFQEYTELDTNLKRPSIFRRHNVRTRSAHAEQLYEVDVSTRPLASHHDYGQFSDNNNFGERMEISNYHPYTFLAFHIADIVHNMGWMTSDIQSKIDEARQIPRSNVAFKIAFGACYEQFCLMRNTIPVQQNFLDVFSGHPEQSQRPPELDSGPSLPKQHSF